MIFFISHINKQVMDASWHSWGHGELHKIINDLKNN